MNYTIAALGLIFGLMETAYFGWNFTPQSPAEVICDGISMLICAMSFLKK